MAFFRMKSSIIYCNDFGKRKQLLSDCARTVDSQKTFGDKMLRRWQV